jgi:hypothetical protein
MVTPSNPKFDGPYFSAKDVVEIVVAQVKQPHSDVV